MGNHLDLVKILTLDSFVIFVDMAHLTLLPEKELILLPLRLTRQVLLLTDSLGVD